MAGRSSAPQLALSKNFAWPVLLQQLSHARLRCGIISLGHVSGRRSSARVQQCQCCEKIASNLFVHVFGECPAWEALRSSAVAALDLPSSTRSWDIMYAILAVHPSSSGYNACISFLDAVVRAAEAYQYKLNVVSES